MGIEEWKMEWTAVRSRGEIKRLGKRIDHNPIERQALVDILSVRGWSVSESDAGKKLLRMFLDRSKEAQIRQNPIHLNESFECIYCSETIPLPTVGIRDHCPRCLRGRHVDNVPGDRAAECRGRLDPISFNLEGGVVWISYACSQCAHTFRVRSHVEDDLPTSLSIADLPGRPNPK